MVYCFYSIVILYDKPKLQVQSPMMAASYACDIIVSYSAIKKPITRSENYEHGKQRLLWHFRGTQKRQPG